MDWGTLTPVADSAAADAYETELQKRFPETPSAYVPSGKMGGGALPWLALGAMLGVPAGALVAGIAGLITLLLFAVMGGVIAVVAACGWVVCMTVVIEIGIALIGGGVTFGLAGLVPAWIVAELGRRGLNRSPWAAVIFAVPSAFVATAVVVAAPYVIAYFVPAPFDPDELSFAGVLHTFAGTSWIHMLAIGLGFLVALAAAAFFAHSEVGVQKFCERCQRHMDLVRLPGVSFDRAAWIFERIGARAAREVPPQLTGVTSELDVELELHQCKGCSAGFFEGRLHARMEWLTSKGEKDDRHIEWLCFSAATTAVETEALAVSRLPEEAE